MREKSKRTKKSIQEEDTKLKMRIKENYCTVITKKFTMNCKRRFKDDNSEKNVLDSRERK